MPQAPNNENLPASIHIEVAVLGAMLLDELALRDALSRLAVEDFLLDSHQRIFRSIAALAAQDGGVDSLTVQSELVRRRELDAIGGAQYLAFLTEGLPRNFRIDNYIQIVKDKANQRKLMRLADSLNAAASESEQPPAQLVATAKRWLDEIELESGADAPMESVAEYLATRYADEERVFDLDPREQGVPSGFPWQDDKTGGYVPGKLYIIAARPSMGKTAKAINDVSNLALKAKVPVALFTFEQPKEELLQRLLCCRATASLTDFIKGRSDYGDKEAIRKAFRDYQEAPLYWDDSSGLTASQIRARCLRLKKKIGSIGAVFIDQLSFMSWEDVYEKGLRPDQLIGRMTRSLKRLARELHVPVILVCQLGRSATKNKDARPTLADLKESGAIEENADVVAFLHRAEYYDRSDPSLKGKGEYIIAKQRQGPVGSHVLNYMAASCKWVDKWEPKDGDDDGNQIPW